MLLAGAIIFFKMLNTFIEGETSSLIIYRGKYFDLVLEVPRFYDSTMRCCYKTSKWNGQETNVNNEFLCASWILETEVISKISFCHLVSKAEPCSIFLYITGLKMFPNFWWKTFKRLFHTTAMSCTYLSHAHTHLQSITNDN